MNRNQRRSLEKKLGLLKCSSSMYQDHFFHYVLSYTAEELSSLLSIFCYSDKNECIFFPKDIADKPRWPRYNEHMSTIDAVLICSILVLQNAKRVAHFLNLRDIYYKFFLQESYSEARDTLVKIEQEFGFSLWIGSQNLLLSDIIEGYEGNSRQLSSYLNDLESQIYQILFQFYSHMADDNMSYSNYTERSSSFVMGLPSLPLQRYFAQHVLLDSNFDPDFSIDLQFSIQFSLIDAYDSLVEAIRYMVVKNGKIDEKLQPIVKELSASISHYSITHLVLFCDENLPFCISEDVTHRAQVMALYTDGNYTKVIEKVETAYKQSHCDFQDYKIYAKAIAMSGATNKISAKLVSTMCNLYTYDSLYKEHLNTMQSMYKRFYTTGYKNQLKLICLEQSLTKIPNLDRHMDIISDSVLTPRFSILFRSKSKGVMIRESFSESIGENAICSAISDGKLLSENLPIDPIRLGYLNSVQMYLVENYTQADQLLRSLNERYITISTYYKEKLLVLEYLLLVEMQMYYEAMDLVVTVYLNNPHQIYRLDLHGLVIAIKYTDDQRILRSINYPIILFLSNASDISGVRIAFSNFSDANGIYNEQDLIKRVEEDERQRAVFFLHRICTTAILKRDVSFQSRAQAIRLYILNILIKKDENNSKKYMDEIGVITTQKAIQLRVKQINHSKVYVDTDAIFTEIKPILTEDFAKYMNIKGFSEPRYAVDLQSESLYQSMLVAIVEQNQRLQQIAIPMQETVLLRDMLRTIINDYLKNPKHGLDTYLSSRIRHGYSKGQLTHLFRVRHLLLVSEEAKNQTYTLSEYWDPQVEEHQFECYQKIKRALEEFTVAIENEVQEVNKQWIRISSEDCEGMFDYSNITLPLLVTLANKPLESVELLFSRVIDELNSETEKILARIRGRLQNELARFFHEQLGILESNLRNIRAGCADNIRDAIVADINLCKSGIDAEISTFAQCFYLDRSIVYSDFTFKELLDTCISIECGLQPELKPQDIARCITYGYRISGEAFPYLVDIMVILINNAIQHSGGGDYNRKGIMVDIAEVDNDEKAALVSVLKNEDRDHFSNSKAIVRISVKNRIPKGKNSEVLLRKITSLFSTANDRAALYSLSNREGGSGLMKVLRILRNNLRGPHATSYGLKGDVFFMNLFIGVDLLIKK